MAAPEQAGEVAGPRGPLRGTLLTPADSTAAVPILPGSGPTDRDGDNPPGIAAAPYRLPAEGFLAEGLAAKGFATLRTDERGRFGSAAAMGDPNAVTIADDADDVRDAGLPVLILQGGRDLRVPAADARRPHDSAPGSTLALFPEADHVLEAVPTPDRAANLATHADPAGPLAPGLVERIAASVAARARRRAAP